MIILQKYNKGTPFCGRASAKLQKTFDNASNSTKKFLRFDNAIKSDFSCIIKNLIVTLLRNYEPLVLR